MGVRDCGGWAVRMQGGLEERGRAGSKSQVGYPCVTTMQGGGTWVWKTVEQGENVCSAMTDAQGMCNVYARSWRLQGPTAKGHF